MRAIANSSDREAWLAARAEMLTASDVPHMLCCGWHKSEDERVQQRAVLRTLKAFGGEAVEETRTMRVARYLEPAVIEYARCEMGLNITHNTTLYASDECPRLGATTDAVIVLPDGTEADCDVKVTFGKPQDALKPGSAAMFADGVPTYWACQVNAQMAVSGRQKGYILALHRGDPKDMPVNLYEVPRIEALITRILEDVPVFWDEVLDIRAGKVA